MIRYFLNILLVAMFLQCKNEPPVDEKIINAKKAVDHFHDTLFFNYIRDIESLADDFLLIENGQYRVFRLDDQLQLIQVIDQNGDGPKNYKSPDFFDIYHDTLFIEDPGHGGVAFYNLEGEFLGRTKKLPFTTYEDFDVQQQHIFLSDPTSKNPLKKISTQGDRIQSFGSMHLEKMPVKSVANNDFIMLSDDNQVLAINTSRAVAYLYDLSTLQLRDSIEFIHPIIGKRKEAIDRLRKENPNPSVSYKIVGDANLIGNQLYLLIYSSTEEEKYISEHIMVISVADRRVQAVYRLKNQTNEQVVLLSFGISRNNLVTYDARSGQILLYNLEK